MREGTVIIPRTDNDGVCLLALRNATAMSLVGEFGGCTIREAHGCWMSPEGKLYAEPVWELVTAYEPSFVADGYLRGLALGVGFEARQECVYVRYASGLVEIVNTMPANEQAA